MLSKSDRERLQLAIAVAATSTYRKWRVGAVLVKNGNVIASACNVKKNNPKQVEQPFCSVHAEIAALRQVKNPEGADIYVARVLQNNTPAMAKPCLRCQQELSRVGIRKMIWTEDESYNYARVS